MRRKEKDPAASAKGILEIVGTLLVIQMILAALFCGGMIWLAIWLISEYLM